MVAAKLDRKLRDHILNARDNLFSGNRAGAPAGTSSRPVLVIVDRNVDFVPMLSHSWTYQSLIHDVLSMRLNTITIDVPVDESNPGKDSRKIYDLTSNDFFWNKNAGAPFPNVAEDIDVELKKYTDETQEITKKTGASSIEELQNVASGGGTEHLKTVMTKLPELRERKKLLDMHMNILTALLKALKDRKIDDYFQLEEDIKKQTKAQILDLINDAEKGNQPLDKLRLFIIWFLSTEQDVSRADMERFEAALKSAGVHDTSPLTYIRRVREITRMTMISSAPTQQAPQSTSASTDLFRGLTSRFTDRLKDAGIGVNLADNILSGVKNFLPANKDLTLTKITESLMDPQNASTSALQKTEGFLYFDPRSANARGTMPPSAKDARSGTTQTRGIEASFGQRRQGFSEAIVFTVGGGSMDEYGNLQEWAKRTSGAGAAGAVGRKRVIYGSTELVNAEAFLEELGKLGAEA
jgi:sec1 family domain-containing protein 1